MNDSFLEPRQVHWRNPIIQLWFKYYVDLCGPSAAVADKQMKSFSIECMEGRWASDGNYFYVENENDAALFKLKFYDMVIR